MDCAVDPCRDSLSGCPRQGEAPAVQAQTRTNACLRKCLRRSEHRGSSGKPSVLVCVLCGAALPWKFTVPPYLRESPYNLYIYGQHLLSGSLGPEGQKTQQLLLSRVFLQVWRARARRLRPERFKHMCNRSVAARPSAWERASPCCRGSFCRSVYGGSISNFSGSPGSG